MACCGGKRQQLVQGAPAQPAEPTGNIGARRAAPLATVTFEYIGQTGLTALGPITGKRYRFGHTGAAVAVDVRDAPALVAIPHLRRSKAPASV
jgi:hypothetical protein